PPVFSLAVDSFRGARFPAVAVIDGGGVSVLLNLGDGNVPPPGGSGQRKGPDARTALFPGDAFPRMVDVHAALKTWPSSPAISTSAIPPSPAVTSRLEGAGVERFFAAAVEQDHGFAWSRSKREGLLSAGDRW